MKACCRQGLAFAGVALILIGVDQVSPPSSDWLKAMLSTGIVTVGVPDVQLIAGFGTNPQGQTEAWVVILPE